MSAFLINWPAGQFPALICNSSRRKCIHLQTWGWGPWRGGREVAQDTEIAAKSLWWSLSLFMCIVVYIISQCSNNSARFINKQVFNGFNLGYLHVCSLLTLIKKEIVLIYKEIQNGAVAKSYLRKGFLHYKKMRKYLTIYEEAVSHIWLCNYSILNFFIYEEICFYQCTLSAIQFANFC